MTPLSTARALSLAEMPLGHATTWCPCHGYLEHPHLDVAAARVVACGGGLEVTTEPHPKAGQTYLAQINEADRVREVRRYPATRTIVRRTGHARILSTPDGLTLAEEQAALAQARAAVAPT